MAELDGFNWSKPGLVLCRVDFLSICAAFG